MSQYEWERVAAWLGDGSLMSAANAHNIRVMVLPRALEPGSLARVNGQWTIAIRASVPDRRWVLAHELGHFGLQALGYANTEDNANGVAAALLMPVASFRARMREVGPDPRQLALPFRVTESAAVLRYGELSGQPLVLVTPQRVRVRGPEEWVWPSEERLRRGRVPGLAKVRLRDDWRRVALVG